MSPEIKFRAWVNGNEMVEVDAIVFNPTSLQQNGSTVSGPFILDQHNDIYLLSEIQLLRFIGLGDKDGNYLDWWENDLLRKGSAHPNAPIGKIVYCTQRARWAIVGMSGSEFCGLATAYHDGWTKIGNINENPELLK